MVSIHKVLQEKILDEREKEKSYYERARQTKNTFDNIHWKHLQDNLFDKKEYDSFCNIVSQYVIEI